MGPQQNAAIVAAGGINWIAINHSGKSYVELLQGAEACGRKCRIRDPPVHDISLLRINMRFAKQTQQLLRGRTYEINLAVEGVVESFPSRKYGVGLEQSVQGVLSI